VRLGTDRGARRAAPLLAAAAMVVAGAPAVHADETPTAQDVHDAQVAVTAKADDVARIRARIAAATERVDDLAASAAQAAEAYNGAQYALEEAEATARSADAASRTAVGDVEKQRLVVERLAVAGVSARAPYNRMRTLFSDGGPSSLLGHMSAYNAVGDASRAALATYASKRAVAASLKQRADAAVARREKLAATAAEAKKDAEKAVAGAAAARAELQRDRDQLIRELAHAEGISVKVARTRQKALERLAEQAQLAANRPQAGTPTLPPTDSPAPAPAPRPGPAPLPRPDADPPKQAKGVEAAIRFALEQVGEPYVWAGAGPDVWDCSGLTMRAWQAAGKGLPHFSGAQYASSSPIAVPEARRGDLLFWSRGGPGSIYHVALYLGDGWMVEAPRPGKNVQVVSVYAWRAPDLAGRVR